MGGCASKNKQPKEEAYKPANAPAAQPDFEEIVPEQKAAVASKPAIRINGTVADGDKREYRNSLVGPGGVILPNQREVKDETDPSIPYIDASEDELDEDSSPARAKPILTADVETTVEANTGIKAPEVPQTSEVVAQISKEAEELKAPTQEVGDVVKEVAVVADTIKAVEVHPTNAAKQEVNIQPEIEPCKVKVEVPDVEIEVPKTDVNAEVPKTDISVEIQPPDVNIEVPNVEVKAEPVSELKDIPKLEVKESGDLEVKTEVPSLETENKPVLEVKDEPINVTNNVDVEVNGLPENETGDSLVDEVMKGVGSGFLSTNTFDTDKVKEAANEEAGKVEASIESTKQDVSEEAASLVTSGKDLLEEKKKGVEEEKEKVVEGLQNGFAELEKLSSKVNNVSAPVVDGMTGFDLDKAYDQLMTSSPSTFTDIDDSAEFSGFRLAKEEETDCRANPEVIEQVSASVGVVYSPFISGVGFRVGEKCIMTAYHLIREMLDKMAGQGVTNPEQQLLNNKEIWIQFEYLDFGEYEFDNLTRFRFASIRYTNPQLDVAILELEENELKSIPPPLANFCGIGKRHKVEFVGHDPDPEKRRDLVPLALQPTIKEIQKAGEWCQKKGFPPRGYDGIKDISKMRFQCAYQRASSGSPGVVVCEDEVYVVALLTKGYPSFYLDVESTAQEEIPTEFRLVETASMTDVYVDMKDDEGHSELCNNIFGLSVSKQTS